MLWLACFSICVAGAFVGSVPAMADESKGEETLAAPGDDLLFGGLSAVAPAELEAARGGERTVLNLEDMVGQVEGNSISGTVNTGAATVSGDSFQDFNGVSSVIINSGNNVSIQSSTTVNIVIDGNR